MQIFKLLMAAVVVALSFPTSGAVAQTRPPIASSCADIPQFGFVYGQTFLVQGTVFRAAEAGWHQGNICELVVDIRSSTGQLYKVLFAYNAPGLNALDPGSYRGDVAISVNCYLAPVRYLGREAWVYCLPTSFALGATVGALR